MKWISGKDQDRWVIEEIFHRKKCGYFVDLAATDGIKSNNTYLLEKYFDWKGICIEANPVFHKALKVNRKCHIYTDAVDSDDNSEVLYRVLNGPSGGIIGNDTDNNPKVRNIRGNNARIQKMTTRTLESILDEVGAPRVIEYLSLDVEGAETRILRTFPFHKYTFLAMTIERPTKELNELLFKNGYHFVKNSKMDTFYIHESLSNFDQIKLEPFEQIPPKLR